MLGSIPGIHHLFTAWSLSKQTVKKQQYRSGSVYKNVCGSHVKVTQSTQKHKKKKTLSSGNLVYNMTESLSNSSKIILRASYWTVEKVKCWKTPAWSTLHSFIFGNRFILVKWSCCFSLRSCLIQKFQFSHSVVCSTRVVDSGACIVFWGFSETRMSSNHRWVTCLASSHDKHTQNLQWACRCWHCDTFFYFKPIHLEGSTKKASMNTKPVQEDSHSEPAPVKHYSVTREYVPRKHFLLWYFFLMLSQRFNFS